MKSGSCTNSNTQITAITSTVDITASDSILAKASNLPLSQGVNGYTQIASGGDLNLTATNGHVNLKGGNAAGSIGIIKTTFGGDITILANGSITFTGGSASIGLSQAKVLTQAGGNIILAGANLLVNSGIGLLADASVIAGYAKGNGNISCSFTGLIQTSNATFATGSGGGSINLSSVGSNAVFTDTNIITQAFTGSNPISLVSGNTSNIFLTGVKLQTNSGNIALDATGSMNNGGEISLNDTTILANVGSTGQFSAEAGTNISFDAISNVTVNGGSMALALFVVDNNNPSSVGLGSFTYPVGAKITVSSSVPNYVRIYTAQRSNNSVATGANINGLNYVPHFPAMGATNNEVWNVTFPTVPSAPENGSDHFTIYYKSMSN